MSLSRTLRAVSVALALVAAARDAQAQLGSLVSIGAAAGITLPKSGLDTRAKSGYNAMITAGLHAPLIPISLRAEAMFNEMDYDKGVVSSAVGSKSARIWGFTANALLTTSAFLGPYAIGGVGYYSIKDEATLGTTSHTNVGGNLGAGFRFALTGFSAYAEARYHWVDNGVAMLPISFGLSF